jgi:hypothetical protein
LILNLNFKIQFEFVKVFNMKLVELEIMKIAYLGNFSSHYMILGVISNLQLGLCSLGEVLQCWANRGSAASGMGAGQFHDLLASHRDHLQRLALSCLLSIFSASIKPPLLPPSTFFFSISTATVTALPAKFVLSAPP